MRETGGWIDTHAHLWDGALVRRGWNPPAPLDRTYAPEDWAVEVGSSGIASCIYVEAGRSAKELHLMARWAATHPAIGGFIAPIATDGSDTDAVLARWHATPEFRGVRAHFEDGSVDLLHATGLAAGLRQLAEADVLFEFLVTAEQLRDVHRLCVMDPDLRVVIEHMGKPRLGERVDPDWRTAMAALATDTSAVVKLSLSPRPDGFAELARRGPAGFPLEALRPLVDLLLDRFGPERLVWGSDWPVSQLTAPTAAFLTGWRTLLDPVADRLNATARRVYRLPNEKRPVLPG